MRDEQVEPVAGLEEVGKPGEDRDPPDKLDVLRAMGDMRWEGWVIGRGSMRGWFEDGPQGTGNNRAPTAAVWSPPRRRGCISRGARCSVCMRVG